MSTFETVAISSLLCLTQGSCVLNSEVIFYDISSYPSCSDGLRIEMGNILVFAGGAASLCLRIICSAVLSLLLHKYLPVRGIGVRTISHIFLDGPHPVPVRCSPDDRQCKSKHSPYLLIVLEEALALLLRLVLEGIRSSTEGITRESRSAGGSAPTARFLHLHHHHRQPLSGHPTSRPPSLRAAVTLNPFFAPRCRWSSIPTQIGLPSTSDKGRYGEEGRSYPLQPQT